MHWGPAGITPTIKLMPPDFWVTVRWLQFFRDLINSALKYMGMSRQ